MWTRERLVALLDSCNVPWREKFGIGAHKRLEDLLGEVNKPEIRIVRRRIAGRLRAVRKARTVRLRVTTRHLVTGVRLILREIGYSFPHDVRNHQRPFDYGASLSETIPIGKKARAWAVEAIAQELQIPRMPESFFLPWLPPEHKTYESAAYFGMISDVDYVFFKLELPAKYFQEFYYSYENGILSLFGWEEWNEEEPSNP